jgi:hypothetical protein
MPASPLTTVRQEKRRPFMRSVLFAITMVLSVVLIGSVGALSQPDDFYYAKKGKYKAEYKREFDKDKYKVEYKWERGGCKYEYKADQKGVKEKYKCK